MALLCNEVGGYTGWCLVVLRGTWFFWAISQYRVVQVGTWCYWVSIRRNLLALGGAGSDLVSASAQCLYALIKFIKTWRFCWVLPIPESLSQLWKIVTELLFSRWTSRNSIIRVIGFLQVRYWDQKDHPITRFALYLTNKGLWSEQQEKEWKNESKKQVKFCFT